MIIDVHTHTPAFRGPVPADRIVMHLVLHDVELFLLKGTPINCRVAISHSHTLPSFPPDASILPSGLNATLVTTVLSLISGVPTGWRLATSHRCSTASVPGPTSFIFRVSHSSAGNLATRGQEPRIGQVLKGSLEHQRFEAGSGSQRGDWLWR